MAKRNVIDQAYSNVPKEPAINPNMLDFIPDRAIRYYWIRLVRFFTR